MTETHNCPQCGVEYYIHVSECPDCLIPMDQEISAPEVRELNREDAVSIATGAISTLRVMEALLKSKNIAHIVELVDKGRNIELTPSAEFGVFIHPDDVELVAKILRKEVHEEFPELMEADEALDSGNCPACGANAGDSKICPECELPLWFEDDE